MFQTKFAKKIKTHTKYKAKI